MALLIIKELVQMMMRITTQTRIMLIDGEMKTTPVRGLTKNEAADSTGRSWSS